MKSKTAYRYFGSKRKTARAIGITPGAISRWGEVVPLESALALQIATDGELKVDYRLYPAMREAIENAKEAMQ